MHEILTPDVRARVDAHLDAVENQLQASGADRTRRRSIADDLETQILDMLAARNTGKLTPTDVDAVLAGLDPPSAYANSVSLPAERRPPATPPVVVEPRLCPAVKKGTRYFAVVLIGVLVLILAKGEYDVQPTSSPHSPTSIAMLVGAGLATVVGPFLVTVFGWIATERIRRSDGREYGLGLAVVEALLFPTLVIWVAAFALSGRAAGFLECFAAPVLLTAGLACLLRWSTDPKRNPAGRTERSGGTGKVPITSN